MDIIVFVVGLLLLIALAIGISFHFRERAPELAEEPIPEFTPVTVEIKVARRLQASNIEWEI